MKLSIVTINFNNVEGLTKTLASVQHQTCRDFQYVIVDGASTDGSVEVIKQYAESNPNVIYISEPDSGIYCAMNKGIRLAEGDFVEFLNSGDCLMSDDVVDVMYRNLNSNPEIEIMYGNMMKSMRDGWIMRDRCFAGNEITFMGFYTGTLNHSSAYIKKTLFEKFGLYDEKLKIVSDWKWYMQAIILGGVKPLYVDVDVTLFDMTGISETNYELDRKERRQVLTQMFPATILIDYDLWSFGVDQLKRLQRYPLAYKAVWFLERCLFKFEKWRRKQIKESRYY